MTTKDIPISDILGEEYYIYEIIPSNYNPSINDTITITCTVTDVFDQLAKNKTLTLYENDQSKGSKTTNDNGVCTWTIDCANDGLRQFRVEDTMIEVYVRDSNDYVHDLHTVAITGSYDDLTDKPTIPTATSELTNDSGFVTSQDLTDKEDKSNKVTQLSNSNTDIEYPSAKAVYSLIELAFHGLDGVAEQISQLHSVAYNADYNKLNNLPTIPYASETIPIADAVIGSYGNGEAYAREDHVHPRSSLYARANHTHTISEIQDQKDDILKIKVNVQNTDIILYFLNTTNLFTSGEIPRIDWGDGSITDDSEDHQYNETGIYEIKIYPSTEEITTIPEGFLYNEGQFDDNQILSVKIPSTVTTIRACFGNNTSLTSITIPNETLIYRDAFSDSHFEEIIFLGKPHDEQGRFDIPSSEESDIPSMESDPVNIETHCYFHEDYYDQWSSFLKSVGPTIAMHSYISSDMVIDDIVVGSKHAVSSDAMYQSISSLTSVVNDLLDRVSALETQISNNN